MDTLRKIGRFVSANAMLCFLLLIVVMASAGGIYAGLKLHRLQTQNEQLQHDNSKLTGILISAASHDSTARQAGATLVP